MYCQAREEEVKDKYGVFEILILVGDLEVPFESRNFIKEYIIIDKWQIVIIFKEKINKWSGFKKNKNK